MKRVISLMTVTTMVFQLLFSGIAIAAEGPAQPEAAQFEPVDATDMVNLFTGDFSYNIPLLEVPGPEGNWPINMAYHAGVGPNTEATWVGLGWTLNPGAINRFVSGYPDDYWNGNIISTYEIAPRTGWGIGLSLSYGPVGISMSFDSEKGFGGVNGSLSLTGLMSLAIGGDFASAGSVGIGKGVGLDISLQFGSSGVGLSASLGKGVSGEAGIGASLGLSAGIHSSQKPSFGGGYSVNFRREGSASSLSLAGVSFSNNSQGASFSVAGTGFQSQSSMEGSGNSTSSSFSIPIPIGFITGIPGLSMSISYYEWEWWLKEKHIESSFGVLHQPGFLLKKDATGGATLEEAWDNSSFNIFDEAKAYFNNEEGSFFDIPQSPMATGGSSGSSSHVWDLFFETKFERKVLDDILYSSEDIYQVNVQGLSGSFKPYFEYAYKLYDETDDNQGQFHFTNSDYINTGGNIKFRFEGDQGRNFVGGGSWGDNLTKIDPLSGKNNYGSKKIEPALDPASGMLWGFRITDIDGKIYEFFRPTISYSQYSKTKNDEQDLESTNTMASPYATSWLLTGIKGPDYVDMGEAGFSNDDYGFWVYFAYTEANSLVSWRTPYNKGEYAISPGDLKSKSFSEGIKNKLYLRSIETATHIAKFETSERDDDLSSFTNKIKISASRWEEFNSEQSKIYFPISKDKLEALNGTQYNVAGNGTEYSAFKFCVAHPERIVCTCPAPKTYRQLIFDKLNFSKTILTTNLIDEGVTECSIVIDQKHHIEDCESGLGGKDIKCGELITNCYIEIQENSVPDMYEYTRYQLDNGKYYYYFPVSKNELQAKYLNIVNSFICGGNPFYGKRYYYDDFESVSSSECRIVLDHIPFFYCKDYRLKVSNSLTTDKFAQKLDIVSIHKKKFKTNGKTDYDLSFATDNPTIESVKFDYGYDLIKGAENSQAVGKGKLTLLSFQKRGRNNIAVLPQTEFSYYGENVNWGKFKFDHWNGYTSQGKYYKNFNSQLKSEADSDAATWSLKSIATPLGSFISIDYESDMIENVNDKSVENVAELLRISGYPPDQTSSAVSVSDEIYNKIKEIYDSGYDEFWILETKEVWEIDSEQNYTSGEFTTTIVTINSLSSTGVVLFSPAYRFQRDIGYPDFDDNGVEYNYYFIPKILFGGGHRVAAINLTDVVDTKKTLYNYSNGVVPTLPSLFSMKFFSIGTSYGGDFKNESLLLNFKYNQLGPSPAVGYQNVEVMDVDSDGKVLNGKTVQEFWTAKDMPFVDCIEETGSLIQIIDKTGIYGRLKSISTFGVKPNADGDSPDDFYPVKEEMFNYKYSSELRQDGRKIFGTNFSENTDSQAHLGLTQQKYKSQKTVMDLKNIDHQKENIFMVGTTSKTYFYDAVNYDAAVSTNTISMDNIGYDEITGNILLSRNFDSQDRQIISEQVPAYWKYGDMKDKNMLSQLAGTRGYVVDAAGFDFAAQRAAGIDAVKQYLTSSTVTTWKDWGYGAWRQNDTYTATKIGGSYTPFNLWTNTDADNNNDFPLGWKRTSNITKFDRYGHPVEERGLDGTYTSSIYGYEDALPVAIAKNAKESEIFYDGFENSLEWDTHMSDDVTFSHTGAVCGKIVKAGSGELYSHSNKWLDISIDKPKKFHFSGWIYSDGPSVQLFLFMKTADEGGYYTYFDWVETNKIGEWVYLEKDYMVPNDITRLNIRCDNNGGGTVWFDDVRLHPTDASMSTFAYDPLTWQVTSITDANNISTYYEYDDAGRLIAVKDQDGKVLSTNNYQYGRDN